MCEETGGVEFVEGEPSETGESDHQEPELKPKYVCLGFGRGPFVVVKHQRKIQLPQRESPAWAQAIDDFAVSL
jgi:hypothetical protein